MAVDYNLVILGSGPVADYAAHYARSLNARVAIARPTPSSNRFTGSTGSTDSIQALSTQGLHGLYHETIILQSLQRLSQSVHQQQLGPYNTGDLFTAPISPIHQPEHNLPSPTLSSQTPVSKADIFNQTIQPFPPFPWPTALPFAHTLLQGQLDWRSPASLELSGVDVVEGDAVFGVDPELGLAVGDRYLRSHAYLIALDGAAIVPAIDGIDQVTYHTLETLLQPDPDATVAPSLPPSMLIVSQTLQGIESAYCFATLGTAVTLVTPHAQLLPGQDQTINRWVQSRLVAVGVTVHLQATVTQVTQTEQKQNEELCCVHVTGESPGMDGAMGAMREWDCNIMTHCLLLVMGRQVDFTALNLSRVGVRYDERGVEVNQRYRSSQPRIFACGDAIAPSIFAPQLNRQWAEGAIAIHHALFQGPLLRGLKPWIRVPLPPSPATLPIALSITPTVTWVGFTEQDARQQYGDELIVLRQSFQSLDQAQLLTAHCPTATSGGCTLLVIANGQIVGAQVVGIRAEELIAPISLAMQQSIPMDALAQLYPPFPSLTAQILQSLVLEWQRNSLKRRSWLFDGLERFLDWQRDWS